MNNKIIRRTREALHARHAQGLRSVNVVTLAGDVHESTDTVRRALETLSIGAVARYDSTLSGWHLVMSRWPKEERVLHAVKLAAPNITRKGLAYEALIKPEEVFPLLQYLVTKGKLRMRKDGWYDFP